MTLVLGWILAGYIAWPIIKLSEAAGNLVTAGLRKPADFLSTGLLKRKDEIGKLARMFDIMTNELQQALMNLENTVREKEALLQEINHRVKNNLQLIISILNLQADRIRDPESRFYFKVSQERIYSLALLHEEFYQARDFHNMNITPYICNLRDEIKNMYREEMSRIEVITRASAVYLSIVKAIPFGLLFYEIFTNAVKHAYPPGTEGKILITLGMESDTVVFLQVRDSGIGLAQSSQRKEQLGFTMMNSLSRQLNGTIGISDEGGVSCNLRFSIV